MKANPPPDPAPPAGEQPAAPVPAETTAPAPPPQAEPPKPVSWPEWFGAMDVALAVLVGIVAFLNTSFVARNTDLWMALATGRALVHGEYRPGADPFSYTGAGRAWADTSWLFDLGAYAVYSADESGAALVAVKAVGFATAFGLLFLLRRPGQALWPWAVFVAVAVIAAAPYAAARSITASLPFLAATLVILYRQPWAPGTWRQPGVLAGLFWLWACTDGWFLLGPLTVALVLVGEKLNPLIARGEAPAGEAFWPAPPTRGLVRALWLGVIACLLNPMVLAAAVRDPGEAATQLVPMELGFSLPAEMEDDYDLAGLMTGPRLDGDFFWYQFNRTDGQIKLPEAAFAVVLLGSLVALAAGFYRLRATHVLLWAVFAVLAFRNLRLIPFFCLVAVPLAAGHLNGLSARARLGPWTDTRTQLLLVGSALGRVLSLIAALLMLAATYPGWLHRPAAEPGHAHRLDWAVAPDPGLARAARAVAKLRADGLPESVRGLEASGDLGNFRLWYTPGERVFVDTRYVFHRDEMPDLLAVRRVLVGRRSRSDTPPDLGEVGRVCDERGAGFVVEAAPYYRPVRRVVNERVVFTLASQEDQWVLWHLDGRSAVLGRSAGGTVGRETADRLRFDPSRLAFGPGQEPMPQGKAVSPPPPTGQLVQDYLARPEPVPPEADDAEVYRLYGLLIQDQVAMRWQQKMIREQSTRQSAAGGWAALIQLGRQPPVEDAQLALPVLAVRAARRAVAAAPDRAEVYRTLEVAYLQPLAPAYDRPLPLVDLPEPELQAITGLARYLARVPPPDRCPTARARLAYVEARRLAEMYRQTGQLDLALATVNKAVEYARVIPPESLREILPPDAKVDDPLKAILQALQDEQDRLTRAVQRISDRVDREATPLKRFQAALDRPQQGRLPAKAIEVFKGVADLNEFGPAKMGVVVQMITLELQAGRLEDAAADLATLDPQIKELTEKQPDGPWTQPLRVLQGLAARLAGDFPAAAEALNVDAPPSLPPTLKPLTAVPQPVVAGGAAVGGPAHLLSLNFWGQAQTVLAAETVYQYKRALLALDDADMPEAKRRLEAAARPQGIGPQADLSGQLGRVHRYLELIRRYEAPPGR